MWPIAFACELEVNKWWYFRQTGAGSWSWMTRLKAAFQVPPCLVQSGSEQCSEQCSEETGAWSLLRLHAGPACRQTDGVGICKYLGTYRSEVHAITWLLTACLPACLPACRCGGPGGSFQKSRAAKRRQATAGCCDDVHAPVSLNLGILSF